jgi:hypothetical protein
MAPEQRMDTHPFTTPGPRRILIAGVAWMLAYIAVRFLLESGEFHHPWDLLVALVPIPVFLWFGAVVRVALTEADELQRRIHLEALALAFPATVVLLMTLGLIDSLPTVGIGISLYNLWALLPPLWGVCVVVASERYR